jgi:hypothetical protein
MSATSELIDVKNKLSVVEDKLSELMEKFCKKETIDFDRPSDYGARMIVLEIPYDEFNVAAFDKANEIKDFHKIYVDLRKAQKKLEAEYNKEIHLENIMRRDVEQSGHGYN